MIVTVSNLKGGAGKTTTSIYLAGVASRRLDGTVILVDADPQGSSAEWLEEDPIEGVTLVEAPSARLVSRAAELADGAFVVIDTPPWDPQLAQAAMQLADVVVMPTQTGRTEPTRVVTTDQLVPGNVARGVVINRAKPHTKSYAMTRVSWEEAGWPVWASIPERVAIGDVGGLSSYGLIAAEQLFDNILTATNERTAS